MARVKVHFRITTDSYYNRVKYRTRTIEMETVKEDGWECPVLTADKAWNIIQREHIPAMKERVIGSALIWTQVMRNPA